MDIKSTDIYIDEEVRPLNKKTKKTTNLPLSSIPKNIVARDSIQNDNNNIVVIKRNNHHNNNNNDKSNAINSSSSSNFHNRRSYVNNNNANDRDNSINNNQFNNLTRQQKIYGPTLKIDTQHVQNVMAATANYLRKSVETCSPASTISNITPLNNNDMDAYENKSNVDIVNRRTTSSSTVSIESEEDSSNEGVYNMLYNHRQYPLSSIITTGSGGGSSNVETEHTMNVERQTTLINGPHIISEPLYDGNDDTTTNMSNTNIQPLSAVTRSSAANSIDFNNTTSSSRGLASPLGRMILRSPSPSIVYRKQVHRKDDDDRNKKNRNNNNVINVLESKDGKHYANSIHFENAKPKSPTWSVKLHQFKHNVNNTTGIHRRTTPNSSSSLVRESFSSSSDDVSLEMETSSFEDRSVNRMNKPDFQRSRSVDFVNQQILSNNARNAGKGNKYRIRNREKSLSSDIAFDGEIRNISIRRKLSKVSDVGEGDDEEEDIIFSSILDDSSMAIDKNRNKDINSFRSISNSRKRQQDGSPCEFEAPPKITAKSNLCYNFTEAVSDKNMNNDDGDFDVPSPPQQIRHNNNKPLYVDNGLDLPPLRRTLSPNFMNARGRSRVVIPRGRRSGGGVGDSSFNNIRPDDNEMMQEKFLSVKHLPSPSPPAKIIDPAETVTNTAMDANNVDICGLSSMDDEDGRLSMPPPMPITAQKTIEQAPIVPMPMEEPEFLLPTIDSNNGCVLKTVSCETVNRLVNGEFNDTVKKYIIVDCRFEYEYKGGHIKHAINIVKPEHAIEKFFKEKIHDMNTCILFHCEFSSHRAPKMMREVRNLDRKLHEESYPQLYYPQLYLIKGGYKEFFKTFVENCEPQAYVEMLHGDFKDVCKSTASLVRKSWKRHKSFDMDILRHSSPALLSTINQLSGGNDGSSSKRNNNNNRSSSSSSMRSSRDNKRNRRNRSTNRSIGNFPRHRRSVNLFADDDDEDDSSSSSNERPVLNRRTSYSEGFSDFVMPTTFTNNTSSFNARERDHNGREANTF